MRLSKTSALAALAMARLARTQDEGVIQAREIARHLGIPTDSALKILQGLARRGLIESQLGRGGGYRLKGDARQISLLSVVEAIDGPIEASVPVSDDGGSHATTLGLLRRVCTQAADHTRESLSAMSIDELAVACTGQFLAAAG